MDRKAVREALRLLEARQFLLRLAGGGRGCRIRYIMGPAWPRDGEMGTAGAVHCPISSPSRAHALRIALPLFEDELWYTDIPTGSRKPWLLGMWAGDYREWTHKGTRHTHFEERFGSWEIVWYAVPRDSHAFGRKGRTAIRKRVGTVLLMPHGVDVSADVLEHDPALLEKEAHRLLEEISRNRRLALHGLLLPVSDTEYAQLVGDFDVPMGRTEIASGVWVDHSKGPPELETKDRGKAVAISHGLQMLRAVPDLPHRLDRIEVQLRAILEAISR